MLKVKKTKNLIGNKFLEQVENMAAGYRGFYEEQKSDEEAEEESGEDEEAVQNDDDIDYIGKKKRGTIQDKREMYIT